ncbi:hypothetical protein A1OS_21730 [Enterovibrio norvegicus]|uniref:hypothetical protein n=1 Tax=Enterovibrio norvegicus TaxID=188144 RepID=UPI000311865E|nr:hypothetical protein [Enterovibrio norvegicus]OEE57326.1 hypothetical protein A1OS_21730 [Enterovibrio norvegicus]
MNILILGSMNTIFVYSYFKIFKKNGANVFFANTSSLYDVNENGINLYTKAKNSSFKSWLRRLSKKLKIDRINYLWKIYEKYEYSESLNNDIELKLEKFLLEKKIDIVFSFWGTTLKKEIESIDKIIKRNAINLKLVHCVNTYPVRYELTKDIGCEGHNVLKSDSDYFDKFDALICASHGMKSLFRDVVKYNGLIYVELDFLEDELFSKNSRLNYRKNSVVFLGNVSFENRSIDDVGSTLLSIANSGVDVWLQEPCAIKHPNIHTFKPFNYSEICDGKLGDFIGQFSASIVLYNDYNNLRTSISYPTRFALATLGDRPIIIQSGVFDGIEDYSNSNQIEHIYTYNNLEEIKDIVAIVDGKNSCDKSYIFRSSYKCRELKLIEFMRSL